MTLQMLAQRNSLVTGGGSGLGREIALLLAAAGANVLVVDRDAASAEETVSLATESVGRLEVCRVDVTDPTEAHSMVETATRIFGSLDCAVNNAGVAPDNRPVNELDENQFRMIMDVNLLSVAWCLKHEMRAMKQQRRGGSIVNIGSTRSFRASATAPAYTAAKSAVIGLTESAALAGGRDEIRVNAVCPGVMATPMVAERLDATGQTEKALLDRSGGVLGRIAFPIEVAQAVAWLCSDLSSYVTGHSLVADGGYLAR